MQKKTIYFNIKEIANIIQVSPATIRNWEKNDLFIAKRNSNNYREYSIDDVKTLKKIRDFSIEQGMNSISIKKALEHENSLSTPDIFHQAKTNPPAPYPKYLLNQKWRKLREDKKLTLEEVSQATGISISYLSKIENGNANTSLDILNTLSEYYGETLLYFSEESFTDKHKITEEEREPLDVGLKGVYIESLIQRKNTVLRPTLFTVLPHSGQEKPHTHNGEEFIYVLKGEVEFILNDTDKYKLSEGDSLSFQSTTLHCWENKSDKKANLIWVHSPISPDT